MTAQPERSVAAGNQHDELLVERLDPQEMSERDYHGAQQDLADRQSLRRLRDRHLPGTGLVPALRVHRDG